MAQIYVQLAVRLRPAAAGGQRESSIGRQHASCETCVICGCR